MPQYLFFFHSPFCATLLNKASAMRHPSCEVMHYFPGELHQTVASENRLINRPCGMAIVLKNGNLFIKQSWAFIVSNAPASLWMHCSLKCCLGAFITLLLWGFSWDFFPCESLSSSHHPIYIVAQNRETFLLFFSSSFVLSSCSVGSFVLTLLSGKCGVKWIHCLTL